MKSHFWCDASQRSTKGRLFPILELSTVQRERKMSKWRKNALVSSKKWLENAWNLKKHKNKYTQIPTTIIRFPVKTCRIEFVIGIFILIVALMMFWAIPSYTCFDACFITFWMICFHFGNMFFHVWLCKYVSENCLLVLKIKFCYSMF